MIKEDGDGDEALEDDEMATTKKVDQQGADE
jgi:hypothetical protein